MYSNPAGTHSPDRPRPRKRRLKATGRLLVDLLRARKPRRDPALADDIERGIRATNTPVEPVDPWTSP